MTAYKRGDIVLVGFVFSDETGQRQRPAVIVSSEAYHTSRQEAVILAITSRTDRILAGDHLISEWKNAGLLFPSAATGIVRTVKRSMIIKILGVMPPPDMQAINQRLKLILGLL